jgi:indole-3-glycerol phosphate synthase
MISVLVDRPFFGGSYEDLASCRAALDDAFGLSRPRLLCKEFVLDRIQLQMASSFGADAVLLIARLHPPERLAELAFEARSLFLEPLVEVTNEAEAYAAQAVEASLIGVNARDLDTLAMDQERAASVLAKIDPRVVRVHLSGLSRPEDVARVASGSADAALIGEALMRQDDPRPLLSAMVASASVPLIPSRRS